VKISIENNVLTIRRHEGSKVAEERTERVHRYERTYGAFERTRSRCRPRWTPPTSKATYEHGVLTVTLPRSRRPSLGRSKVQVQSK